MASGTIPPNAENISNIPKTNRENGIVLQAVPGLRLLEYLVSLSSIVPAKSITDAGSMGPHNWAFFFDSKETMDTVISKITVKVGPSAILVINPYVSNYTTIRMRNVPPFVTEEQISESLLSFGKVISIRKVKVRFLQEEFQHINSFTREISMELAVAKEGIPNRLQIKTSDKNFSVNIDTEPQRCHYCKGFNHFASKCRKRIANERKENPSQSELDEAPRTSINRNYANAVIHSQKHSEASGSGSESSTQEAPEGFEFLRPTKKRRGSKRKGISPRKEVLKNLTGPIDNANLYEDLMDVIPPGDGTNGNTSLVNTADEVEASSQQSEGDSICESDVEVDDGFELWTHIDLNGPIRNQELKKFLDKFNVKRKTRKVYQEAFATLSVSPSIIKAMILNLKNEITPTSNPKFRRRLEGILKKWPPSPTSEL